VKIQLIYGNVTRSRIDQVNFSWSSKLWILSCPEWTNQIGTWCTSIKNLL